MNALEIVSAEIMRRFNEPKEGERALLDGIDIYRTEADALADAILISLRSAGMLVEGAAADVVAERQRQMSVEGWSPAHDDEHTNAEMALAATAYVLHAYDATEYKTIYLPAPHYARYSDDAPSVFGGDPVSVPLCWPWAAEWWKPKNVRRDLVRAAALLLAEIDRLDRALLPPSPEQSPEPQQ